ncbi:unnamed protein product [Rotaria socialis]|uniref:Uncharacterized protein n=1 Tax=Rotaria socialis TaxID=392032 RepID=A0A820CXF1_9BILA|nr:unnamed protein product [Rotaria socialis]
MVDSGRTQAAYVFTVLILELGIIHLGVESGIVGQYCLCGDIFCQPVSLSVSNIVIDIFGIIAGILGLITISQQRSALTKIVVIVAVILGIFAIASLIAGFVVNSQTISGVRSR